MEINFKNLCEHIDAGIFVGDILHLNKETLEGFKEYLGRWQRQAEEAEKFLKDNEGN